MKRYWVFCGDSGGLRGGAHDDHEAFDDIMQARQAAADMVKPNTKRQDGYDWAHVWDAEEDHITDRYGL